MLEVGRRFIAAGALAIAAAMLPAGAGAADPTRCGLGGRYFVRSVTAYKVTEDLDLGYSVYTQFKGAEAFVPAQPGLTAEWLQRVLSYQIAAGECDFGVRDVAVSVLPAGGGFTVRLSGKDDRAAAAILQHAQQMVR